MARLSESELASLLEEIAHALRLDCPLPEALDRLSDRRFGAIGNTATRVAERLRSGETLEQAAVEIRTPMIDPLRSVLSLAGGSRNFGGSAGDESARGASPSVSSWRLLHRFAGVLRKRSDSKRQFRLALAYPCLLTLIAYLTMVLVATSLIDQGGELGIRWPGWIMASAHWFDSHRWFPLVILVILVIAVYGWVSRLGPLSKASQRSLFCFALADQCEAGVCEPDAISNAAKVSSVSLPAVSGLSLSHPQVESIIRSPIDPLAATTSPSGLVVSGSVSVEPLRHQAKAYLRRAERQQMIWSQTLPNALALIFGSAFCLGYVILIIRPIYQQAGGL